MHRFFLRSVLLPPRSSGIATAGPGLASELSLWTRGATAGGVGFGDRFMQAWEPNQGRSAGNQKDRHETGIFFRGVGTTNQSLHIYIYVPFFLCMCMITITMTIVITIFPIQCCQQDGNSKDDHYYVWSLLLLYYYVLFIIVIRYDHLS